MNAQLEKCRQEIARRGALLSDSRKRVLDPAITYILDRQKANEDVSLNFICTHNSRRSHLAQVLAAFVAKQNDVGNIHCFSGGTEATRIHPNTVAALGALGFSVSGEDGEDNPRFIVDLGDADLLELFSKRFDHEDNPNSQFAAVMVCSSADSNCPFVPGADKRISITYDDPKAFDQEEDPVKGYVERALQIGSEWHYIMQSVSDQII